MAGDEEAVGGGTEARRVRIHGAAGLWVWEGRKRVGLGRIGRVSFEEGLVVGEGLMSPVLVMRKRGVCER